MRVAILGFGNQGAAHAVCLRASGWEVTVGARPGAGADRAAREGFPVLALADAASRGEFVALLLPDEVLIEQFPSVIAPALRPGSAVVFAHGFALRHGDFAWPPGVDAVLVSPTAPGAVLAAEFRAGRGVPAYCAVAHDASGRALERAESYAAAIGSARARLLSVTVEDEVVADLFGEQVVLVGGLLELVTAAVDTLVGAGIPKALAYLECAHQVRYLAELLQDRGAAGFLEGVSTTARFGALVAGPRVVGRESRQAMTGALEEIRSGRFAAEFLADQKTGGETLRRLMAEALQGRLSRLDDAREAALGPAVDPGKSR